jgi:hypothetical protein
MRLVVEPRHQFRELFAARLISSLVFVERGNVDVELVRDEGQSSGGGVSPASNARPGWRR